MLRKILAITLLALFSYANIQCAGPDETYLFEGCPISLEDMNRAATCMVDDTCQATTALKKIALAHPIFMTLTAASLMGKKRVKACLKFAVDQPFLVAAVAIVTVGTQTTFAERFIQNLQNLFPSNT
jgi:hypothetical protein